jgi:hypothetical protein
MCKLQRYQLLLHGVLTRRLGPRDPHPEGSRDPTVGHARARHSRLCLVGWAAVLASVHPLGPKTTGTRHLPPSATSTAMSRDVAGTMDLTPHRSCSGVCGPRLPRTTLSSTFFKPVSGASSLGTCLRTRRDCGNASSRVDTVRSSPSGTCRTRTAESFVNDPTTACFRLVAPLKVPTRRGCGTAKA